WSATSSPRPETLIGLTNVSFQLSSCPLLILLELVISSVQSPLTFFCASAASGSCGLNRPKNGAPPLLIGVVAVSSKTVLLKLALLALVLPTLAKSGTFVTPSGAIRTAERSGSFGKLMFNCSVALSSLYESLMWIFDWMVVP